MKKTFISTVSLALVFSMALSFASCDGDDDATKENTSTTTQATQTNVPQETEKQTENATDAQTDTPDESEPTEDTATNAAVTTAPEETTTAPVETTAPEETSTHILTAPPEDPSIDYSQWGKYGFEKMLPEPLPYSDQEADWHNARFDYAPNMYVIVSMNKMYSTDEESKACCEKLEEYANSLKKYGYDLYKTVRVWELTDDFNNTIAISIDHNRIYVEIILATV